MRASAFRCPRPARWWPCMASVGCSTADVLGRCCGASASRAWPGLAASAAALAFATIAWAPSWHLGLAGVPRRRLRLLCPAQHAANQRHADGARGPRHRRVAIRLLPLSRPVAGRTRGCVGGGPVFRTGRLCRFGVRTADSGLHVCRSHPKAGSPMSARQQCRPVSIRPPEQSRFIMTTKDPLLFQPLQLRELVLKQPYRHLADVPARGRGRSRDAVAYGPSREIRARRRRPDPDGEHRGRPPGAHRHGGSRALEGQPDRTA